MVFGRSYPIQRAVQILRYLPAPPAPPVVPTAFKLKTLGSPATNGTAGSILFINGSGDLAQDNTNFFWDASSFILKIQGEMDFQASTATFKVGGATKLDYGVSNAAKWTFVASPIVPAYTVGTLPTGVAGAEASVTDGDAGLAWGATAINSGAGTTHYLVWYNGAHWTVAGK